MFLSILQHTPPWVFAVLVLLVVMGLRLTRTVRIPLARLVAMPIVFGLLALSGLVRPAGTSAWPLAAWLLAYLGVVAIAMLRPARSDVRYAPAERRFVVPGSWLPLVLMLAIFFVRYAVAVAVALHPDLSASAAFGAIVAAIHGAIGGCFAARALRIGRVAMPRSPSPIAVSR